MADASSRYSLKAFEAALVAIGALPFDALWRAAMGFVMIPLFVRMGFDSRSDWLLFPFLLVLLLAMRLFPALFRKAVPFSPAVREIWAERRSWAKAYDSYQWQKMLYIGIGLAFYIVGSGEFRNFRMALCLSCLVAGTLGLIRWQIVAKKNIREKINERA